MGPMFSGKIKHDAKMLLVIWGDFPTIVVHSLGWCHIMINPCKDENWRLQKVGRKVQNIFWMKGLEICPFFSIFKPAKRSSHTLLGGGFNYFLFSPLPEEMIQFDEHIFQMG